MRRVILAGLFAASLRASNIQWLLPGDVVDLSGGGVFDSLPFSGTLNEFDYPVLQIYNPNDEPMGIELFDLTADQPVGGLDLDFNGVPLSANVYQDSNLIPGHVYQLTIGAAPGAEASLNDALFGFDPPNVIAVPEPSTFLSGFAILAVWRRRRRN